MAQSRTVIKEVIPTKGMLFQDTSATYVLCKPKLLPLKSITLEKLEKMQQEAEAKVKQQLESENQGMQNGRL